MLPETLDANSAPGNGYPPGGAGVVLAFNVPIACRFLADDPCHRINRTVRVHPEGALPDGDNLPLAFEKSRRRTGVTVAVGFKLCPPEFAPGVGNPEVAATCVGVPEATIDENNGVPLGKHKVRPAWQGASTKPVAETTGPEAAPDQHLRLCISAPDKRHHP